MASNIIKYTLSKKNKIITYQDKTVFVKPKKRYNIEEVYKYLDDHNVTSYLPPLEIRDRELVFPYLPKTTLAQDEKVKKLILSLSLWQNKTTIHQANDMDKIKEIYEERKKYLTYIFSYYKDLHDLVASKVYMMPSEYLFIRNVTSIYTMISFANHLLEKWYHIAKEKKTIREVYCHGKCSLDHFLEQDTGYFISLENAHLGDVTEDFTCLYHHHFKEIDIFSTYQLYQHKYPFTEDEKLFFYLNLVTPRQLELYPSSLEKTRQLHEFFEEINLTQAFLSEDKEYNKSYQKE